jgi:antitoxin component YwqK of YwqJK toxin-antitoxin module
MKQLTILVVLIFIAAVSGCTSTIESGQLDYDNGVAYKHGDTDPFTGKVHFAVSDNPQFVSNIENALNPDHHAYEAVGWDYSCLIAFKNGTPEGDTRCTYANGNVASSFILHHGLLDGEAIRYNEKGDKVYVTHWDKGVNDGEQKVYSADGRYVIHEWTAEEGHKRGKEVRHYADGDDLAEGKWDDDGKFTGTMYVPDEWAIYTLKDGVKDGGFKELDRNDPSLKLVSVEGSYSNGQMDGTWTYHGQIAIGSVSNGVTTLDRLIRLSEGDEVELTWKGGELSGPIKVYDKDKHALLSFSVAGGKILPPVERFDPESNKKVVFTDGATISALNYNPMDSSSNPDLAREAAGMSQRDSMYQQVHQALDVQRQLQAINRARVDYVLDPVHNPDPATIQRPSQPVTTGQSPSMVGAAPQAQPAPPASVSSSQAAVWQAQAAAQAAAVPASPVSATSGADTGLSPCVSAWIAAFRKEKGEDVIVTKDQLDEWAQWCSQGKQAP